jgi:drug/metabolite transporter (DMT)-like permease
MTPLVAMHTLISLAAIASGVLAVRDLLRSRAVSAPIILFLGLAVVTSLSGFVLPFRSVTPAVAVAIVALAILAAVLLAATQLRRSRVWQFVFAGGIVASLYLLVFVGIVQAFAKIAELHSAAPTQSEPPFLVTQIAGLLGFVLLEVVATRSFRPETAPPATLRA